MQKLYSIYDYTKQDTDYTELPWDLEVLEKNDKKGILAFDVNNKRVYWFKDLNTAIRLWNKWYDKDISPIELREATKLTSEERIVDGIYWTIAFNFDKNNLELNAINMPRPIKNDRGHEFDNATDAAKYLVNKGIAKGSHKRVRTSILKNLRGETKRSYGMTWTYIK